MIEEHKRVAVAQAVVDVARELLHAALQDPQLSEKTGGSLCILDARDALPFIIETLGTIPEDKSWKYIKFSAEKPMRIFDNPSHPSSFLTRDGITKWAGAIRTDLLLIGFSGLPELADEALVAEAAYRLMLITSDQRATIYAISSNYEFAELFRMLPKTLAEEAWKEFACA